MASPELRKKGGGNEREKMGNLGCCMGDVVFDRLRHRWSDQRGHADEYRIPIRRRRVSACDTLTVIAIKEP